MAPYAWHALAHHAHVLRRPALWPEAKPIALRDDGALVSLEEIAQSCRGLTRASPGRQHESLCDSVSVAVVARHTALSPSVACACGAAVTTAVTAVLIVSLHLLLLPLMLL